MTGKGPMTEAVESVNALNGDLFEACEADRFHDPDAARKKAMDFLARREYGRLELCGKLENAGFETETVRIAVDRLVSEGLQSDRRFVENFLRSRIGQGKGPVRIRLELEERGLEAGLIDEILSSCEEDWVRMARRVRDKKFGAELPGDFREKARQMRFLQQRGFEPGQIQAAVSAALD